MRAQRSTERGNDHGEDTIRYIIHEDFKHLSDDELRYLPPGQSVYQSPGSESCESARLSADGEAFLFRKMNYLKWCADQALKSGTVTAEVSASIDDADSVRNVIIESHLGLVRALARKFSINDTEFEEFLSEGYEILLKAVELFDVSRGFRFSTYATHALQRHYYRLTGKRSRANAVEVSTDSEVMAQVPDSPMDEMIAEWIRNEEKLTALIASLGRHLDEREQHVVTNRFGLNDDRVTRSLREIGEDLGLSKERARQLQISAIEKLRVVFDSVGTGAMASATA